MANERGHMCDMPVCEQSLMETSATEAVYFSSLKKPRTSLHNTDTGGRRNPSSEALSPPQQTSFAPVIITNRYNIKLQAPMLLSTLTALQGGWPFLPRCDFQIVYFPPNFTATRSPQESANWKLLRHCNTALAEAGPLLQPDPLVAHIRIIPGAVLAARQLWEKAGKVTTGLQAGGSPSPLPCVLHTLL